VDIFRLYVPVPSTKIAFLPDFVEASLLSIDCEQPPKVIMAKVAIRLNLISLIMLSSLN